jgi:hypothetical protein
MAFQKTLKFGQKFDLGALAKFSTLRGVFNTCQFGIRQL